MPCDMCTAVAAKYWEQCEGLMPAHAIHTLRAPAPHVLVNVTPAAAHPDFGVTAESSISDNGKVRGRALEFELAGPGP